MSSEAVLIQAINSDTEIDLPAFGDVPANRPAQFITVEQVGGQVEQVLHRPMFAIQVWGGFRAEAAELAHQLADRLKLWQHPRIAGIDVASIYNFPDPSGRHARYQLTVSMIIMPQA